MRKYFRILTLCLAMVFLFSTGSFSEEKKEGVVKGLWNKTLNVVKHPIQELTSIPQGKPAPETPPAPDEKKKSPWDDMTEEEIRERVKNMVQVSPEAVNFIPELKIAFDKDGQIAKITYEVEGVAKDVKELDKNTLIKLHNRINIERVRIQTERIQRQLNATRASRQIPRPPPQPPKIPRPPQQPPKIHRPPPAPPPAPPRR